MTKRRMTILLTIVLIISLGVVGGFWYEDKKGSIKKENIAEQQIDNYQRDIIDVLLKDTDEIVRDVDTSSWKELKNSGTSLSFRYPENLKILDVTDETTEEEKIEFLEYVKKGVKISIQADGLDITFHDKLDERIGFLRVIVIKPYNKYITWETEKLTREEAERASETRNVWKINRRKNNRVHPKSYESVGYVRSDNNIFPWTVVDAGYKDVFSMSDILCYDEDTDSFVSIEIRMFDYDEETKDILYGILKTIRFN